MNKERGEALMAATAPVSQTVGLWAIDSGHSSVEFSVRHMMVSTVKGHFGKVEGTMQVDANDHAASIVEAKVDVSSIMTRDENRDGHLKSADFFNAEQFPTMIFKSTKTERVDTTHYRVTGDLTIRDVTKPVVFTTEYEGEVKDMYGKQRAAYTAETEINRKDYGLTWNAALEGGGVVVSEKVKITLNIALVHQG